MIKTLKNIELQIKMHVTELQQLCYNTYMTANTSYILTARFR